jgi:ankyrin repeat protein
MRVLKGSDLTARDNTGQTILHVAVSTNQSDTIVRHILQCGVDLASRDCHGRTARDLAEKLNRPKYVRLIDDFVIKLVKDKKFEQVEKLILTNYDHILDISEGNKSMTEIAKKSSTRNISEIVKLTAPIQVGALSSLILI